MLVDAVVGMKAITSVYKGYGDLVNGERRGFCQLWVICNRFRIGRLNQVVVVNVLPHRGQNLLIHRKQIAHLFSRALGLLRNRL